MADARDGTYDSAWEPNAEQLAEWEEWCDSRPTKVAEVARRLVPWKLYQMRSTGQRVVIVHYDEEESGEVSLSVDVSGAYNFLMFDRQVFGVDPDDLELASWPPEEGDIVGTLLPEELVGPFIDEVARPAILGPKEAERVRREIEDASG